MSSLLPWVEPVDVANAVVFLASDQPRCGLEQRYNAEVGQDSLGGLDAKSMASGPDGPREAR
ncbi:hypothetical protein MHPYR_10138 [uncultured Mycobacterium sp.]|uniref:Uncharacterized protein n=1 Tax=uncultured Mycobacterium sp. TaxID=171292 RepID=A0A1Y5NZA6_9MYCO|nr:hypothetical protein MHPYR_10138 [uncultured Mycobacterium sp.]